MNKGGNRRTRTAADVGGSAGNGPGGGNAAEQRTGHVAHPLCNQFHVGIVLVAGHTVGYHTGKQGFNPGQQCDGHSVGEQHLNAINADLRPMKRRQGGRNGPIPARNGIYRQIEDPDQKRAEYDARHRRGHTGNETPNDEHHHKRCPGDAQRHGRQILHGLKIDCPFAEKFRRSIRNGQSEKIPHLLGKNDQCDARRKPGSHRIGDKLND